MIRAPIKPLRRVALGILERIGTPPEHGSVVIDHLIEASQMGIHSHGVARVPQYVDDVRAGLTDPTATPSVLEQSGSRLLLEGRRSFGQVAGFSAAKLLTVTANEAGSAVVTVRGCGHTGRIGAYVEKLAMAGLVALGFSSGDPTGHRVAPHGGRDPRFATNPIAYAVPSFPHPVVADFSTSAATEGAVRLWRTQGVPAPDGVLVDADGRPTNDPNVLYEEPKGSLQLLGGRSLGHKGYSLALLVEYLATTLAGEDADDTRRSGSNLTLFAIDPGPGFADRARRLGTYVTSSRPTQSQPVLLPGERERERLLEAAHRIDIDDVIYQTVVDLAAELDVQTADLDSAVLRDDPSASG